MPLFNWKRWLRTLSRPQSKASRKRPLRIHRTRLDAEQLEDRTVFSVLPPAIVTSPATIATSTLSGFSPSIAYDPINPQKLIEVHSTGAFLVANYSTDGGQSWSSFITTNSNLSDPTLVPASPFTTVTNTTVAIDRAENIYIVDVQHNAGNTAGVLVMQRWRFNGGSPTAVASEQNTIVQQWTNADPVLNPVVAVDNNVASFTDPLTGDLQTDTLATLSDDPVDSARQVSKALYIAWNTNDRTPTTVPAAPATFNPNVIMVAGSGDGGEHWTAPQIVNGNGHIVNTANGITPHYSDPQIVFTQGSADGRVTGGQLVFVWNDFGSTSIKVDASLPDGGDVDTAAADSRTFLGGTGPFTEANAVITGATLANAGTNYNPGDTLSVAGGTPATTGAQFQVATTTSGPPGPIGTITGPTANSYSIIPPTPNTVTGGAGTGAQLNLTFGPDAKQATTFTSTVSLPASFTVNSLEVTLNLLAPDLSQLSIDLVQPGAGGATIHLVQNRLDATGATLAQGISGAGLGELNGNKLGTVFADNAPDRSPTPASPPPTLAASFQNRAH